MKKQMTIAQLVEASNLPRELVPTWNKLRLQAFQTVLKVYEDRVTAYDVDHPPYEEMIFGPVSFATELFKRIRRLVSLLSPLRVDPLREADLNRIVDICVDCMNYLSWLYAMVILATGLEGHELSDDSPDYSSVDNSAVKS